jgi:AcrR family transcriptional regulator
MHDHSVRTPNAVRRARTRAALVAAARTLFAANGYAATGTPEIVTAAGVTRGALYHHFQDKTALFRAVVETEQTAAMAAVEAESARSSDTFEALVKGGEAFLDVMDDPGRQRILLIDAPVVLGRIALDDIDKSAGRLTLRAGIDAAIAAGRLSPVDSASVADLMNALYDRVALAIAAEPTSAARRARKNTYAATVRRIWEGLRSS